MKITSSKLSKLALLLLVVLAGCIPIELETFPTPTVVPPISHVVADVIGLDPIWVVEKVYIIRNDQDETIESFMGKSCFLGDFGERNKYQNLICLENQSGDPLRIKESGIHDAIAVTSDGIFVTYIGPASVRKYDFQNGDLLWTTNDLGGRMGSSYLYFQDGQIEVLFKDQRTVVLDTVGNEIRTVRDESVFISTRDEILIDLDGLQSNKANSKDVLWKYKAMNIRSAPLFTDDKIFVRQDFSKTEFALDRNTGKLLWEVPGILGNFAYSPNKKVVYALRENGDLLAISENNGKESIVAKFSPAPFIYFDGVDDCGYQLSYDEEEHILVVYTGDSRQLFAFKEK